jgi:hypothetical protein
MNFREASIAVRSLNEVFFSGFTLLCDVKEGDLSQAQTSYSLLNNEKDDPRPVNLAVAHLAMEEPDKAIGRLEKACAAHDPVMVWLHLWPIFDPSREHPRSCALVARMNYLICRKHPLSCLSFGRYRDVDPQVC